MHFFDFDTPTAFREIKVVFTNDDAGGGGDRTLYVRTITINGEVVELPGGRTRCA